VPRRLLEYPEQQTLKAHVAKQRCSKLHTPGASIEKDWQKGKKWNEYSQEKYSQKYYFLLREHTNQSWQ